MKAGIAGNAAERDDHFAKVSRYAEEVRRLRKTREDPADEGAAGRTETIIYGRYAGESADPVVESWEDEGGALHAAATEGGGASLPGISLGNVTQYHVGPYLYQNLDLAVAEHLRQLSSAPQDALDPPGESP
ncbi:hypothetical protein [Parerythrobacter lacustris]|uniref:HK97 gp10 family phage protein n=1 Tax=Parerythrobacter lacustris TaxID=2969984 RepID=A0ABT1XPM0_9SPHN|nr:hypothetical protein [Parerythrobacter lacustris]MCR2833532.1 hypothetical protein [Parerythrobacter lacustris]